MKVKNIQSETVMKQHSEAAVQISLSQRAIPSIALSQMFVPQAQLSDLRHVRACSNETCVRLYPY